ncbi:hypothetical protein [Janibacter melonis]|uniref:hypothetical protein n=1 Tax=Janibacter melonis TaxID=262209 RepID=UPI000AF7793A|nr:hypothetical protein [Janibacter melonis]
MSRRAVVVLAAAGATTVVLSACSVLGGGASQAEPTYVAPSTTTTAPSATTAPVGRPVASLPLAADLLPLAKGQLDVPRTVTVQASYPLTDEAAELGPMTVRATGSTGAGRTDVRMSLPDGSTFEQRDLGKGEIYLRLTDGDMRQALGLKRTAGVVKKLDRWVRIKAPEVPVKNRPYDIVKDRFRGGELDPVDMKYGIVDVRELDGRSVYGVLVRPVSKESSDVVRTLWVTQEPPHRFLRYEAGQYPTRTAIAFSRWGTTPLPSERPKGATKVDADAALR